MSGKAWQDVRIEMETRINMLERIEALERKERARGAAQWIANALLAGIAAALFLGC